MAADKRHRPSMSFGVGWLQDQLRARFDIRGPIGEPFDVEPRVQVGMEARPSLPWEYGNARWFPVAHGMAAAAGGAGTFASVGISSITGAARALVLTRIWAALGATGELMLCTGQAYAGGVEGVALQDGRYLSTAGSWLTPVPDAAMITQNVAIAPPMTTLRNSYTYVTAATPVELIREFLILQPGQTVQVFAGTANTAVFCSVEGLLVPLTDLT